MVKNFRLRDLAIALLLANLCMAAVVMVLLVTSGWTGPGGNVFEAGSQGSLGETRPGLEGTPGTGVLAEIIGTQSALPVLTPTFGSSNNPIPVPPSAEIDPAVEQALQTMSLEQKIGQLVMIGVSGNGKTEGNCATVQQVMPGAVFYQEGGNVNDPEQLRQFSSDLQGCIDQTSAIPLIFAIDHEGQYIHRFKEQVTHFPTALAFGATGKPDLAHQAAYAAGQELAYSGINMVLGPVADVLFNLDSLVLSVRTYGGEPGKVSNFVSNVVGGYIQAGVIPVVKHFPGHGGVSEDSHEVLPADMADRSSFETNYLPPFKAGLDAGAPVVMLGHVAFPNITGNEKPATVSPEMIGLLRNEMGFQGVILSDAIDMDALQGFGGSVPQASLEAVKAGVDMILVNRPNHAIPVYERLLKAAQNGELTQQRIDDAVRRILQLKKNWNLPVHSIPPEPDWEAHRQIDMQAGYEAITLCRDNANLVPLPADKRRILIVGPTPDWPFYTNLMETMKTRGFEPMLSTYELVAAQRTAEQENYIKTLPDQAANYDLTILFTWDGYINDIKSGDPYQVRLVKKMIAQGGPVLVVALRAPNDILGFPDVQSYIATYGHTDGGQQGLIDILLGDIPPVGINPLPGLPCQVIDY